MPASPAWPRCLALALLVAWGSACALAAQPAPLVFPLPQSLAPWQGEGFSLTSRPRPGGAQPRHAESGEWEAGTLRSPSFRVVGSLLALRVNGWDGARSGTPGRNEIRLVTIPERRVVRVAAPPNCDPFADVVWLVDDLRGQRVALELVDGCRAGGYAWLGIESTRQDWLPGPSPFRVVSGHGGGLLGRGTAVSTALGVPLVASDAFPLACGQPLPCGFAARRLLVTTRCSLVPLGTELGTLEIRYQDGAVDRVPLACGYTTWPAEPDVAALGELDGPRITPAVRRALARVVRVRPSGLPGHALLALAPAAKPIRELVLVPGSQGQVAVTGVTAQTGAQAPHLVPVALPGPPAAFSAWLRERALPTGAPGRPAPEDFALLTRALRPPDQDDLRALPTTPPAGFPGPRLQFAGNVDALLLTNLYYGTVADMAGKIDADGTFHTSSRHAPDFGAPWLWHPGRQTYYGHAWSRDLGRVLMELVDLGYRDESERCLDYTDRCLFLPTRRAGPGPRHWPMVMNLPDSDNPESDGHGLQMLFHYRAWLHAGCRPQWVREHWPALQEAAGYLVWCLDHPEQSRSQHGLIYSATEAVGPYMEGGFGLYCDVPCLLGLRGYARMAAAAGRPDLARQWGEAASRLEAAISGYYPGWDPQFGPVWDRDRSRATPLFWGTGNAALAPLIVGADYLGFDAADRLPPGWRERTEHTYRRQLAECVPPGACFNGGLGYTHCFLTQAALLLDRLEEASTMLHWLALVSYDPRSRPWVAPEVGWVSPDGTQWKRLGDLGNAVQEGEATKCLRLVLGIDDLRPECLQLVPRLPPGWTGARATGYPVVVRTPAGVVTRRLDFAVTRAAAGEIRLLAQADGPLGPVRVRLGPFPPGCPAVSVRLGGRPRPVALCNRGDGRWAWVELAPGLRRVELVAVPAP